MTEPKPHHSACSVCTNGAEPKQGVNRVTVSLALVSLPPQGERYREILFEYGTFLPAEHGTSDSAESRAAKQRRLREIEAGNGVGSQLWNLLGSRGVKHTATCKCLSLAERMNAWGPAGCRRAKAEIVEGMHASAKAYGWTAVATAAAKALATGLAWRLDLADVYGSLVDEAIRRAESHQLHASHPFHLSHASHASPL